MPFVIHALVQIALGLGTVSRGSRTLTSPLCGIRIFFWVGFSLQFSVGPGVRTSILECSYTPPQLFTLQCSTGQFEQPQGLGFGNLGLLAKRVLYL